MTARKREETIQDVPLAISAISSEALQRAGVDALAGVADYTAGLFYQDYGGGGLGSPVIRGLAQTDIRSVDSNVGVFVDGVFISNRGNLDFGLFDVARVEVVKGPQSALYGNNTFAGAINYVSIRPTDEFKAQVRTTLGNADRRDASASLGGGLIDGKLAAHISAGYSEFDGTVRNLIGSDLGGWDEKIGFAGSLLFTPTDNFEARLSYFYGKADMDPTPGFIYLNNCGGPNSLNSSTTTGRGGTISRFYCGDLFAPPAVTVRDSILYGNQSESHLTYLALRWELGAFSLNSLSSVGKYESDALVDFYYNAPLNRPPAQQNVLIPDFGNTDDWSQELRIESIGDNRLNWLFGGYLSSFELDRVFASGFPANPRQVANNLDTTKSDTWAVFGSLDYEITDQITIGAEARYNVDDRDATLRNLNTGFSRELAETFSSTTYRASLEYKLPTVGMVYVSTAKGTKSGGFNNTPVVSEQTYGSETLLTHELGYKTSLFDRSLDLNVAVFYSTWEDAQITAPSAVPGNTNITTNLGNVTAYGGEVEFTWSPTESFQLQGGYSYSDPTYDDDTFDFQHTRRCATPAACGLPAGPDGSIDVSGQRVDRSIKSNAYLSGTFTAPLSIGSAFLRLDGTYTGDQTQRSLNLDFIPSRTLVNARVGLELENGFEVSAWSRNLLDKEYIYSSVNQPEFVPSSTFTTGHVANGRTYGVTLGYRF